MKRTGRRAPASAVVFGLGLMLSRVFPSGLIFLILAVIIVWLGVLLARKQ